MRIAKKWRMAIPIKPSLLLHLVFSYFLLWDDFFPVERNRRLVVRPNGGLLPLMLVILKLKSQKNWFPPIFRDLIAKACLYYLLPYFIFICPCFLSFTIIYKRKIKLVSLGVIFSFLLKIAVASFVLLCRRIYSVRVPEGDFAFYILLLKKFYLTKVISP